MIEAESLFPIGRHVQLVRRSGAPMSGTVEIGALLKGSPSTLLLSCRALPDDALIEEIAECAHALFVTGVVLICDAEHAGWFEALERFDRHANRFRILPVLPTPHLLSCDATGLTDAEGRLRNTIFFLHRACVKAVWRAESAEGAHAFDTFMDELHERETDIFPSLTLEEASRIVASRAA